MITLKDRLIRMKTSILSLFLVLVFVMSGLPPMTSAAKSTKQLPENRQQIQLSFAPLVKQAAPAVVNVYTKQKVKKQVRSPLFDDPFFKQFFGDRFGFRSPKQRQQQSLGSGVIIDPSGLIVTNHHVIQGAEEIKVALSDRREFTAELVLEDEDTDLAVLRIDTAGSTLPHLQLRDSDNVQVGDLVLAIGNPFNVGQTVTSGIVSAVARTSVGVADFQSFIQTDAAINPGNSGGALVSMDGKLVGVNTAIFSKSGGSLGIGFAIPANMVRVVVNSAKSGLSFVQRPWLGVATQPVTAEIASSLGLSRPEGTLVRAIYKDGPADDAGLEVGDLITALDDVSVSNANTLKFRLGTKRIGGRVKFTVLRDGKQKNLYLNLIRAPETPARDLRLLKGEHPFAGAEVANLSPALAEELGIDTFARGVIVTRIRTGSLAAQVRLRPGDIFLTVEDQKIDSAKTLQRVMSQPLEQWRVSIRRGKKNISVVLGE